PPVSACTFFMKTQDGQTLAGNSEDYYEADTCAVFLPPTKGKYGRVYFGWTHVWMQGGINDQGLAYDIMALWPKEHVRPPEGRKRVPGRLGVIRKIMEECATVEEALKVMSAHVNPLAGNANLMLVDAAGGSAIVEGYTVYRRKGPFQICTNFRWAKVARGKWPCRRYRAADARLKDAKVTVKVFRDVLRAVHQPLKKGRGTLYSNIYDLKNLRIYLYLMHDFKRVHIMDVKKELAKGPRVVYLNEYFPDNPRDAQFRKRYETARREAYAEAVAKLGPKRKVSTDAGPVLDLALDGDAKDAGPHGLHGKVTGLKACADRRGKAGAAMAFAGAGGIEIPDHPGLDLSAGDFTISMWLKAGAEGMARHQVILDKAARGKLDYWLFLAGGRLEVRFKGKNACLSAPGALTANRWYHVALRQDVKAFRLTLFVDGRERLMTMLHSTPARSGGPLRLGCSGVLGKGTFYGAMDELRIYQRPLSNAEISALSGTGKQRAGRPGGPGTASKRDRTRAQRSRRNGQTE
ncbi:hypothetical protein LCGC14_1726230, partial [marine sediment metagenome]